MGVSRSGASGRSGPSARGAGSGASPLHPVPSPPGSGRPAPQAPGHLSAEARAFWDRVLAGWGLDEHELWLLRGGLEAWDTAQRARRQLRREGITTVSGSGRCFAHPAVKIQNDSLSQFRQYMRELGLSTAEDTRPPLLPGRYR